MNILKTVFFVIILSITLAACGGGNSSSEDNSADSTVTADSGATVTFASKEITVGEVFELSYNLGGDQITGTIRWGDNT